MRIAFVELVNFRKLRATRIDFAGQQTLFVGSNNSGKTSAMIALRLFLKERGGFTTRDVTLSNWTEINALGEAWLKLENDQKPDSQAFISLLPALDIWLDVDDQELHRVSHILPTLDWAGDKIGVRIRLEPHDIERLVADYRNLREKATVRLTEYRTKHGMTADGFELWPSSLHDYLDRRFSSTLTLRAYTLDPGAIATPTDNNEAAPQILPPTAQPIEGDPLARLIHIREISAQRGFSDTSPASRRNDDDDPSVQGGGGKRRLSEQLQAYYKRHLDPVNDPSDDDVVALGAFHEAQKTFDKKLEEGFRDAIEELSHLGYPGLSNPFLKISTRIRPTDGLDHPSAVQYSLGETGEETSPLRLPEEYNGLGFQNLISMVFLLIRFRADWMRVGKLGLSASASEEGTIEPLQLVLIEEPEAHLHAQVQQVFIRKAYDVLRNHKHLGTKTAFQTQLVVSTHSSHVAHEVEFASLRYFKRLPAKGALAVPSSVVANLTKVFGKDSETSRFVTRYLRITHCDLFFADASILIEGTAERVLVPHFIRQRYTVLAEHYISILEIGGSHAHRLRPLIEVLGIPTLIITDLDATHAGSAARPLIGANLSSANSVLKSWLPGKEQVDDLLAPGVGRTKIGDGHGIVHVTYQQPIKVAFPTAAVEETVIPSTFEDALVIANLEAMKKVTGVAMTNAVAKIVREAITPTDLCKKLFHRLRTNADKAGFALDLLDLPSVPTASDTQASKPSEGPPPLEKLVPPSYVAEGLNWLECEVKATQETVLVDALRTDGMEQRTL